MTGAFDVAEALNGGISDRERAWAFLRGFAAAWGEPLTDGDGTPAAELARADLEAIWATVPGQWALGYTESPDAEPLPF